LFCSPLGSGHGCATAEVLYLASLAARRLRANPVPRPPALSSGRRDDLAQFDNAHVLIDRNRRAFSF
jgi:hypothetical protein